MDDSAPWKTEETIVGLPRLPVLSGFSRFGGCHFRPLHGFTPIHSEAPFSVTAQGVRPSLQPYFVQTGLEFSA